jgi:hypothetical protein
LKAKGAYKQTTLTIKEHKNGAIWEDRAPSGAQPKIAMFSLIGENKLSVTQLAKRFSKGINESLQNVYLHIYKAYFFMASSNSCHIEYG